MGRTSVARLIRIDKLINELKDLIDNGTLAVRSGVELSFLSEETQLEIAKLTDEYKIDMRKAKLLRESADDKGNVSTADIIRVLDGKKNTAEKANPSKSAMMFTADTFSQGQRRKRLPKPLKRHLRCILQIRHKNSTCICRC